MRLPMWYVLLRSLRMWTFLRASNEKEARETAAKAFQFPLPADAELVNMGSDFVAAWESMDLTKALVPQILGKV